MLPVIPCSLSHAILPCGTRSWLMTLDALLGPFLFAYPSGPIFSLACMLPAGVHISCLIFTLHLSHDSKIMVTPVHYWWNNHSLVLSHQYVQILWKHSHENMEMGIGATWYCRQIWIINSLWPSGYIWWHISGSTLAQVMAPSHNHHLNQC